MLRPSVVCLAKRCVSPKTVRRSKQENGLWGIEWSRDRWRLV